MKRVIAFMLMITMTCGLFSTFGVGASDQPIGTPVSTVSDFVNMKADGIYYLTNDIDFSAKTYSGNVYTREFKGVLDGNGYALLGITVKAQNGDIGIFSNGFNGTLKNITFGSNDAPVNVSSTGSSFSVAVVAGTMKSGAVIENTVIYANVKGDGKTSGITSYIPDGSITVTGTKMYGTVTGNPAAGFFALADDGSSNIKINNSVNYATITAKGQSAGGFYTIDAKSDGSRSGSLVITGCANYGSVTASNWRAGGIVGEFHEHKGSTLTVNFCYNMGTITMSGKNGFAAGIVGGASYYSPSGKRVITNVYNGGTVENTANPDNVYQIAYSNAATTAVTVKNAAHMGGVATKNMETDNVVDCASLSKLISTVKAFPESDAGHRYISVASENGGYPILAHEATSHANVKTYKCGRKICQDCGKRLSTAEDEKHIFKSTNVAPDGYLDGYAIATCTACGEVEIQIKDASAYRPPMADGVYQISTADHLKWYQTNLNAGLLSGREILSLEADIDLTGVEIAPIGTEEHPFGGTFNGNQHTISNLQITSDAEGGLFGVIANASNISLLTLDKPTVTAEKEAGALFGKLGAGAYVKVEWVLVTNAAVISNSASAGGLAGSTDTAAQIKFEQCIVDSATIKAGQYAGGLIGFGNTAELSNCHVNAQLEAPNRSHTGSLAYYTGNFIYTNSGYVKTSTFGKTNGTKVDAEDFTSGAISNKVNTYANQKIYGTNGVTVTMSGDPTYAVYYGEEIVYTSTLLSNTGDLEVYTDGKTVAIVVKRENGPRLTDLSIQFTAGGKTVDVKFGDLTLTRRVKLDGKVCTVESGSALYTLSLANVTNYTIGSFAGSAIQK